MFFFSLKKSFLKYFSYPFRQELDTDKQMGIFLFDANGV